MNKVIITGNLGKDPELKTLSTGSTVANFSIAVRRPYKQRDGERGTDWLSVVVWGTLAENCARYLHKGSKALVVGRIQTRTYEKKDGSIAHITELFAEEVEFLDSRRTDRNEEAAAEQLGFMPVEEGMPF